jgi:hypothetical protein
MAYNWGVARADITNQTPAVGAVAWWSSGDGHVAYVEKVVSNDEIIVSEDNWGGDFHWKRITRSSGWPIGFIHFKDQPTAPATPIGPTGYSYAVAEGATLSLAERSDVAFGANGKFNYKLGVIGNVPCTVAAFGDPAFGIGKSCFILALVPPAGYSYAADEGAGLSLIQRSDVAYGAKGKFAFKYGLTGSVACSNTVFGDPAAGIGKSCFTRPSPAVLTQTPTPTIGGVARVGSSLSVSAGVWQPAPVSLAYQWLRNGVVVAGATKGTYALVAADLGAVMSVRVTGSKAGYTSVSKTSAGTAKVSPALSVSGPVPTVSGTVRVGKVLSVKPGSWQPAPVSLAYQWLRNGVVVGGATKSSYVLTAADLGAVVSVRVTGSKVGYASVVRVSKSTSKVAAGVLSGVKPKVSGKAKVGRTLAVRPGVWGPSGVVLTYQWLRNGKKITGATGASYLVVKADKGKKLTVKVTGTLTGYTTLTKTSAKTKKIK